jgi:hypothetical protein
MTSDDNFLITEVPPDQLADVNATLEQERHTLLEMKESAADLNKKIKWKKKSLNNFIKEVILFSFCSFLFMWFLPCQ